MVNQADSKLAKRLALLVVEAGEEGLDGLRPALEKILASRSVADRKRFLRVFQKAAEREVRKDTLTISSAQPLSAEVRDRLVENFQHAHTRKLNVLEASVPELIAGLRVRLGDTVFDASLSSYLKLLSKRIR